MLGVREKFLIVFFTTRAASAATMLNALSFPVWGTRARARPAFPVFRAKLPHGISYVSPLLPALFLPHSPRLQAAFSIYISRLQASQCGSQMGTEFKMVVYDEHGIGGDGE